LEVVAPADFEQARAALLATWDLPGPVYYRLGKDDRSVLRGLGGRFGLGEIQQVRAGDDLLIFSCGPISLEAVAAADVLAADGIEAAVTVVSGFSPPVEEAIAAALAGRRVAISVETHSVTGGLGSLLAEVIADRGLGTRLVRLGVRAPSDGRSGSAAHLQAKHGLDRAGITAAARGVIAGIRG
jgi:transketolase